MPIGLVRRQPQGDLPQIPGLPLPDLSDILGLSTTGSASASEASLSTTQPPNTPLPSTQTTTTPPPSTTSTSSRTVPPTTRTTTTSDAPPPQNTVSSPPAQQPPVEQDTSTSTIFLDDSSSSPSPSNSGLPSNTQTGFFHNTAAVTATFTVLGIIVAAIGLYLFTTALRRSRTKRLDREIAEAAAIREGFGFGGFGDDDDRLPFHRSTTPPMAGVGGAALASHPSISSRSAYAPSSHSGYSAQDPFRAPYQSNGYYNPQQPPVPPIPAVLHGQRADADPYAFNSAAAATSDDAHPISPTRRTFGQMQPPPPPPAVGAGVGAYGSAMGYGMPRYAQAQAAESQYEHRRTPSAPLAPPPPMRSVVRQNSASSVQEPGGYGDLKIVNS